VRIISIFNRNHREARSGAHERYLELVDYLSKHHKLLLISPTNPFPDRDNLVHIKLSALRTQTNLIPNALTFWAKHLLKRRELLRKVGEFNPDVGFTFGYVNSFPLYLLARTKTFPAIQCSRGDPLDYMKLSLREEGVKVFGRFSMNFAPVKNLYIYLFTKFENFLFSHVDDIVVQSGYHRDKLVSDFSGIEKDKVEVLPNNVPCIGKEPRDHKKAEKKNREGLSSPIELVTVGSLIYRKGNDLLLKALGELREEDPEIVSKIIGDGPERKKLEEMSGKLGLSPTVDFPGYISDPIPQIIEADLVIIPSRVDAFPNTLLEALAVGTPVIAARVGAIPEVLSNNESLLFDPGSYQELAKKIKRVLQPEDYWQATAFVSERAVEYDFDWNSRFEELLEKHCK